LTLDFTFTPTVVDTTPSVPEPTTLTLLGVGLALVGVAARSRRR
jgi:hypothetical protein